MAVAVKNDKDPSETAEQGLLDRLAVRGLLGVLYLLASVALVCYALPLFWRSVLSPVVGQLGLFLDAALMLVVLVLAAVAAIWLGLRLIGPNPPAGLRAAIFWGLAALALAGGLTWAIGMVLDSWLGANGIDLVGQVVVAAIGLLLLVLAAGWYLKPAREDFFVRFEEQGWLGTTQYKRSQGLKVRRGTMVGIWLLAGAGIYTMTIGHQLLPRAAWTLPVPFTGMAEIRAPGDSSGLQEWLKQYGATYWANRYEFEEEKARVGDTLVRVSAPGDTEWEPGQVVEKAQFTSQVKELKEKGDRPPTSAAAHEPTANTVYAWNLYLLPDVKYTVPLILVVGSLWLAWRMVNFPPFADFLIATEAELNKVSWTTRKRLIQDTVVVLATVVLLTLFLLVVDFAWGWLLTKIQVLPEQENKKVVKDGEQPW